MRDVARVYVSAIDLERMAYEESMYEFARAAWPILEPGSEFKDNWHIRAICTLLEAAYRREVRNVLINMPPRCMKSLLISVIFPAWVWTHAPHERFLCASYAQNLSTRDSLKTRGLIKSDWYQALWGEKVQLSDDQDQKTRFENTSKGYRIATSIGGTGTGEGGSFIIVDDPHNALAVDGPADREKVERWWFETMSTRRNDQGRDVKIVVMQRLHESDLSGLILKRNSSNYTHLCIPMRYEHDHPTATTRMELPGGEVIEDPRERDGEILWPSHIDEATVRELEIDLREYGTAGQFQQRPAPRGGGMFKREWFKTIRQLPAKARVLRYWDFAATAEGGRSSDPDWSVGVKVGAHEGITYIVDIRRARLSPRGVQNLVRLTAAMDGKGCPIYIEQEGGASGKTVIDSYQREVLPEYAVRGNHPTGNKERRWEPFAAAAEAGNVYLVTGDDGGATWIDPFLDELAVAPNGDHDDQIDAASDGRATLFGTQVRLSW